MCNCTDGCKSLAVIITNTYMSQPNPLRDVKTDHIELEHTFRKPFFDTVIAKDETKEELEKKIEEAAELASEYKYKSVFIAFSGHGGKKEEQSYIVSNDGVVVWLTEFVNHIVDLFGDEIPKIFLLDSCRGYTELEQRPKRVKRNYLIAYATQDDSVSMLDYDGTYWMPVVARYLREVDDTVVNIINKANLHVQENPDLKYIQHPVLDDKNFCSGDLKIYQGTYYICYVLKWQFII